MKLVDRSNPTSVCPFCRAGLEVSERTATCPGCGATYHADCLRNELNGACAVHGCGTTLPAPPLRPAVCAGCRQNLDLAAEGVQVCPVCGYPHHDACVWAQGTCRRFGCPGRLDVSAPAAQASSEPTPEPIEGRDLLEAAIFVGIFLFYLAILLGSLG